MSNIEHHPHTSQNPTVVQKWLLRKSNGNPSGSLNTDKFLRGLRNTPDPDYKLSPAQILFGRPLRDAFSFINRRNEFENYSMAPVCADAWKLKEEALRTRFVHSLETMGEKTRPLPVLGIGDRVFLQNQTGPHPIK